MISIPRLFGYLILAVAATTDAALTVAQALRRPPDALLAAIVTVIAVAAWGVVLSLLAF